MNRIQHPTRSTKEASHPPKFNIESGLFVAPSSRDASHVLFGPKHYEPNYAYPLIVWLHSAGDDERQLVRIMPTISLRNYVAVAPRGFDADDESTDRPFCGWPQTANHIQEAESRICEAVGAARHRFHVNRDRMFLAGFGSGGTMAFRVAMNDPAPFAGVLSICGAFPSGHNPFGQLNQARRLPIFLTVARDSREYPPEEACENLRLFHAAGMSIVLRQYPCAQQLTEQMLRDVDRWIIEQISAPVECE